MKFQLEDIKKEIDKETKEVFNNISGFDSAVLTDLFFDVLRLPITDTTLNLEGLESRMMNAFNKILVEGVKNEDRETFFADFAKVEPFFRKLVYLLNPVEYGEIKLTNQGLIALINALGLNLKNKNLDTIVIKNHEGDQNFIDHLARVYRVKNIESHEIRQWSNKEVGQYIQSFLVIYLHVIYKYKKQLSAIVKNTMMVPEPSFTAYLDIIISTFKERVSRFIHLSSKEEITLSGSYVTEYKLTQDDETENLSREGTVETLRQNNLPEKRMILWGEAGLGKSTTLEYLTYRDAMRRKSDSNQNIPVYVPLGLLTDPNLNLETYIFNKIGVDAALGKKLLESGRLNLFLDGLNEIPKDADNTLITLRQKEIDHLLKTYKKSLVIITNRPQQINQFSEVPVFFIQKMNDIQIKEFVKKYTEGNKAAEKKIIEAINLDDRLKRIIKTPLMLSRLIEIVKADGEIPANEGLIIDRFIKSLYKREIIEKKDARFNDRYIHKCLAYLASYSIEEKGTNAGLTENEILNEFIKCKKEYGFEIDLDYLLVMAVQLNLLERHDDKYVFAHQSYQDYFNTEFERMIVGI